MRPHSGCCLTCGADELQADTSVCCSNKLTDLPSELAELQQLRVLRVKYNSLTRLPEVLVKMNKLEILELSGNQITTLDDKVLTGLHNVRQVCVI